MSSEKHTLCNAQGRPVPLRRPHTIRINKKTITVQVLRFLCSSGIMGNKTYWRSPGPSPVSTKLSLRASDRRGLSDKKRSFRAERNNANPIHDCYRFSN